MEPTSGAGPSNSEFMRVLRAFLERKKGETVQPPEPQHQPTADYRGRAPPEMLSSETLPKPPEEVKREIISYPDLLRQTPDTMRKLLDDDAVVVRVHPDQVGELQKLADEFGIDTVRGKFFIDPRTGQKLDTVV